MLFFTGARRSRLKTQPFPSDWTRALERRTRFYALLSEPDREELKGHIQVFLAEKNFEGRGGFLVTDEVRVAIAAHACLLLLHRESDYYPGLSSVIVYPGEFVVRQTDVDEAGIVTEGDDIRSGESWEQGCLVISWEDMLLAGKRGYEDYNVVIHECAHQLDTEEGITTGMPLLGRRKRLWERVLEEEYERLQEDEAAGRPTVLDPYGAESPAEFFAVAVECFFCAPKLLKEGCPDLYEGLAGYFHQDPAGWPGEREE
ncbi:MAG TPA: M90 family metallopeptidase [Geobacteraceae bacterium]